MLIVGVLINPTWIGCYLNKKGFVTMNSNICINCICLAICLNKNIRSLVHQCSLMTNAIVHVSSHFNGRGNKTTVHFFHIERDIILEIYSDTTYVFDINETGTSPVIGINRSKQHSNRIYV
jgi:hypothetical protein